jgi:protein associated with RNAse G/E
VYVDITTPPVWDGRTLRAVDLDLDVVREAEGRLYVDDEDEFAEHRVAFGYPDDVAAGAEQSCARVRAALAAGHPPYDGSHRPWLDLVRGLPRP